MDASGVGLGAVLMQEHVGQTFPLYFESRGLTPAERNYSAPQLECLAVVWAVRKIAPYIEHTHLNVEMYYQALRWLRTLTDPVGRLARWALRLQELDFTVSYRPGCTNLTADALSRNPVNVANEDAPVVVKTAADIVEDDIPYPSRERFIEGQQSDQLLKLVSMFLASQELPQDEVLVGKVKDFAEGCLL